MGRHTEMFNVNIFYKCNFILFLYFGYDYSCAKMMMMMMCVCVCDVTDKAGYLALWYDHRKGHFWKKTLPAHQFPWASCWLGAGYCLGPLLLAMGEGVLFLQMLPCPPCWSFFTRVWYVRTAAFSLTLPHPAFFLCSPGGLVGKEPACQCRRCKRGRFDPWAGKIPLEESMATHSSILAWRIPWTEEPGGLEPMRLQTV